MVLTLLLASASSVKENGYSAYADVNSDSTLVCFERGSPDCRKATNVPGA
jgi:hypothetical protein